MKFAANDQGLAKVGNRIPSAPQPLLLEKQKYKISCKKSSDVCPAGTNAAMLLMMKFTIPIVIGTGCPAQLLPNPMLAAGGAIQYCICFYLKFALKN